MTKKQVTKMLLSFGICTSVLAACTDKKNEDEKNQLNLQTLKAKEEAARYEELNSDLALQIAKNEDQAKKNEDLRQKLAAEQQEFSRQRSERERQIENLSLKIRDMSANLHQAESNHKELTDKIVEETARLKEIREAAKAEREALVSEITSKRAQLDAELAKERASFESEVEAQQAVLSGDAQKLKTELDKLNIRLDEVKTRESQASTREIALQQAVTELEANQEELKEERAKHDRFVQDMSERIAAAREMFVKDGKGDVFDKIAAGDKFSFRMSLWGQGSVKNIQEIRAKIAQFNSKKGLAKDNANLKLDPIMHEASKEEVRKQKDLKGMVLTAAEKANEFLVDLSINEMVYNSQEDLTFVNDAFMVTGTAAEVKKLRDEVNSMLSGIAKSGSVQASNMWLNARPVQDVKVNMVIEVLGSSSMSSDRQLREILVMNKIRPLKSNVRDLKDIDLTNPSQYIMNKKAAASCETVDADCLKALKDLGLLDHKAVFNFKDENGQQIKGEFTYAEYLEKMLEMSITKLRLQSLVRNFLENGLIVDNRVRYVKPETWYGKAWYYMTTKHGYKEIELDSDSELDKIRQNEDQLALLASQPIVEKIQIKYEISMIDTIDGQSDSIDAAQLFEQGSLGDLTLEATQKELARGQIEIALPVASTAGSTSQLVDLSLKDFDAGIIAPQKPAVMGEINNKISIRELDEIPVSVRNEIATAVRDNEKYDISKLDTELQPLAKKLIAHLKEHSAHAANRQALSEYYEKLEEYEKQVSLAKQREYDSRSIDHLADLRSLLSELKK